MAVDGEFENIEYNWTGRVEYPNKIKFEIVLYRSVSGDSQKYTR